MMSLVTQKCCVCCIFPKRKIIEKLTVVLVAGYKIGCMVLVVEIENVGLCYSCISVIMFECKIVSLHYNVNSVQEE